MKRTDQHKEFIRFGFSFVILLALAAIWAYFWIQHYAETVLRDVPFGYRGNGLIFAVYAILQLAFNNFYGGYRIGYYRPGYVIYSGVLALIMCNAITYLQTSLIGARIADVWPFIIMTIVQIGVIWLWVKIAHAFYIKRFPPQSLLMVYGGNELASSLLLKMLSYPENYTVKNYIDIDKGIEAVYQMVLQSDGVILCDIPAKQRNRLLKFCFEQSIRTYTTPKISDILMRGATEIDLFDTPLLFGHNTGLNLGQRFFKRLTDIIISGFALIAAAPFMLVIAIVIRLCDGGPVFFRQERCTIGSKIFKVCKFRSMIVDAEKDGKSRPAIDKDPRITPVGRILRATRMDELPQLWNILRGDMSIVGPRAERIEHVEKYTQSMPEFAYRLKVKAGLTGLAQTVGRYNTTPYDKLKLDLMYITTYSLFLDFKLMLMTVKVLFLPESTQGFAQDAKETIPASKSDLSEIDSSQG